VRVILQNFCIQLLIMGVHVYEHIFMRLLCINAHKADNRSPLMHSLFLQFYLNSSPTKSLTPLTQKPTQVYTFIHFTYPLYKFYYIYTIYSCMLKSFNSPFHFNCYPCVVRSLCST
jgi:hypothetical protein